jgi:hypothetical protein
MPRGVRQSLFRVGAEGARSDDGGAASGAWRARRDSRDGTRILLRDDDRALVDEAGGARRIRMKVAAN